MNLTESGKIHGLIPEIPGILYGQHERVDELNERILGRFSPDMPLQPNLDVRPVPTKYAHFPVIDRVTMAKVQYPIAPSYSQESNFTPSTSRGPVEGYFKNVNVESTLRNQYFAFQRGAIQNEYIPSSQSDLYKTTMPVPSRMDIQPHPGLFDRPVLTTTIKRMDPKIGGDRFLNNTRTQLRGGSLM